MVLFYWTACWWLCGIVILTCFLCFNIYAIIKMASGDMDFPSVVDVCAKLMRNSNIEGNLNCRIWKGTTKVSRGTTYGVIRLKVMNNEGTSQWKTYNVHRVAYRVFVKLDIPSDLNVSHICHNSLCINTDHLSLEPAHINNNRNFCRNRGRCYKHEPFAKCLFGKLMFCFVGF